MKLVSADPEYVPRVIGGDTAAGNRYRSVTTRNVLVTSGALQIAVIVAAITERFGAELPLVRSVLAVVLLTFVPGLLVLLLLGVREQLPVPLALYAAGGSAAAVMTVGVGMSLLYPAIGIGRPISELWVVGTVALVNVALGGAVAWYVDLDSVVTTLPALRPTPTNLLFLALPLMGIASIAVLNRHGANTAAIGFLLVVSVVPALALTSYVDSKEHWLAVWGSASALLYFKSLWRGSYPMEMWMHQMVLEQGRWVPVIGGDLAALPDIRGIGLEGVLTDAVLYPIYSLTGGITMMTQLEVVNPLLVSLIPLAMYETFKRYVSSRDAMLAAFVFLFNFRFYSQHYPNAPRDVMATLFLVLIGLLIADSRINRNPLAVLAPLFIVGVGVSHYGAAYIFVASLFLSIALLLVLNAIERRVGSEQANGGTQGTGGPGETITYSLVIFAAVFVLTWYLFTAGGIKFQILSEAIVRAMEPTEVSGLASERVLSEKPFSVETTRNMVIAVFALIGVGTAAEGIRRFVGMRPVVSDEHLVIAVSLTGVFALSFLTIGTGFGKGRILMICLSFACLFAVLALHDLRDMSRFLSEQHSAFAPLHGIVDSVFTRSRIRTTWALFLCLFLLINTGVIAETVTRGQDYGSTTIINDDRLTRSENPALRLEARGCIQCDIQAHVWTLRYGSNGMRVYDGGLSGSYYWYGHSIVAQVDDFVPEYLLTNRSTLYKEDLPADWSDIDGNSYLILTSGNYQSRLVYTSGEDPFSLRETRTELNRSSRIYTSGHSTVYRVHNATAGGATDGAGASLTEGNVGRGESNPRGHPIGPRGANG